ncbi:hypothetical protein EVC24_008 [Rhizobium phage RHph_I4]|nr:hypothetical protein EVC24_008 [Rhizobium phage RHph_I4]
MKDQNSDSWAGVVKIQLPLAGNAEEALIYNKDRFIHVLVPVAEVAGMAGGRVKFFRNARIDGNGFLHIEGEAEDQTW